MSTEKKKKYTFVVEIVDRQRYTWQGQIHWIQEDKKAFFRSVMELLRLMNSALNGETDGDCQESEQV